MTVDEILLMFLLPILLFLFVQLILLLKFSDVAWNMIISKTHIFLQCKYNECIEHDNPSCLSRTGLTVRFQSENECINIPNTCRSNIEILKEEKKLNPFRRVTEDFIVMFLSIAIMIISLHIFKVKIVSDNHLWDILILFFISIGVTGIILLFPVEKISIASTLLGLNTLFGFFIFYTFYIYDINWSLFVIEEKSAIFILYKLFSFTSLPNASGIITLLPITVLFISWKLWRIKQPMDERVRISALP